MREQHRRLAPREPHALPGLLQARPPRVAVEGAADIGATARARATASAVGAVVVDFGFGGSGAAADGVRAGATAAAGVGPGATAVSAVDVVTGCATVRVAVAVKTHDRAWTGRCWSVFWGPSGSLLREVLQGFFGRFCFCILGTDQRILHLV